MSNFGPSTTVSSNTTPLLVPPSFSLSSVATLATDSNGNTVGIVGTGGADLTYIRSSGPQVAILGDSITARSTYNIATAKQYVNVGAMTWLNILSNHAFYLPLSNNFGTSGDTLAQILVRVPLVIAARPNICIVLGGTNDITANTSLASMKTTMLAIITPLMQAGIIVRIIPILPRTTTGSTSTTTIQKQLISQFNSWLEWLCLGASDMLPFNTLGYIENRPVLADPRIFMTDMTSATGDPMPAMFLDGLHPTANGGYFMGQALFNTLQYLVPPRASKLADVLDTFDATNNRTGNRLSSGTTNYGLMKNATGSLIANAGITPTGALADGWRAARGAGASSTTTMVLAKQNPRTDNNGNGERQRITVTISGTGGTAFETYSVYSSGMTNTLVAGDQVYGEIAYEVATPSVNVVSISLTGAESGPASPQTTVDSFHDASLTGTHAFPTVVHKGVLRTPVITCQAGLSSINWIFGIAINAVSNTGSADVFISDFKVKTLT